jgi:hypothetical protein
MIYIINALMEIKLYEEMIQWINLCVRVVRHYLRPRIDWSSYPTPSETAQENQIVAAGISGLNDTPLQLTMLTHLQTEELAKKWLLQEDGSYKPDLSKRSGPIYVSSMIHLSDDNSCRPRGSQTWGIIASLIKQQQELNESQPVEAISTSQVVHYHVLDQHDEDIIAADTEDSTADDFVLTTEHDVFKEFMPVDTDPKLGVLYSVTVEGSPELRVNTRILLEKYRGVFATTLSTEPVDIPPFELNVDQEKWESSSNRGPTRV